MIKRLAARSQVATFLVGGALSAAVDVGLMQLLIHMGFGYVVAASAGFAVSLVFNYAFHAQLTYSSDMTAASFARFLCIVALNYLVTLACVSLAAHLLGRPVWGKAVSLPLVAVIGYLTGKYWTFQKRTTDDA